MALKTIQYLEDDDSERPAAVETAVAVAPVGTAAAWPEHCDHRRRICLRGCGCGDSGSGVAGAGCQIGETRLILEKW